jgi:hypothetical protein
VKAHGEMIFGMIDDLRVKLRVQPFLCNPNDVGFGRTSDMRREKKQENNRLRFVVSDSLEVMLRTTSSPKLTLRLLLD